MGEDSTVLEILKNLLKITELINEGMLCVLGQVTFPVVFVPIWKMKGCRTQSLRSSPAQNASSYAFCLNSYYTVYKWFTSTQDWVHLMPSVQEMCVDLSSFGEGEPLGPGVNRQDRRHGEYRTDMQNM